MTDLSKLASRSKSKPVSSLKLRPELLLCPNVPKPMHGIAPRTVLGRKWWDATRQAAYEASGFCCSACGVHKFQAKFRKWVEGHEIYAIDHIKGLMIYVETVALCHSCHNYVHSGRMQALLEAGKMSQAKFAAIVIHGDRVLAAAGLTRLPPHDGPTADWGKWRLVVGKKRYKGLFSCEADWVKYHKEKNDEKVEEAD